MQISSPIISFICAAFLNCVLAKPIVYGRSVFRFANIYGDHMVLQQAPFRANVWGYGEIGQTVTVGISGEVYKVQIKRDTKGFGVWTATLNSHKGGPYTITATTKVNGTVQNIALQDVLFGDVWICSGQSNMQFSVTQAVNLSEAIQEANNYPDIRLFTAYQVESDVTLDELSVVEQPWSVASGDTVNGGAWKFFSAVCWFYAKNLYDKYKYPLGMIATDWGGTAIEVWSSPEALATCNITQNDFRQNISDDLQFSYNDKVPTPSKPSVLYNSMIHPLLKMTIFGAIWYQGEANSVAPNTYNCTFPAMIDDWRKKWYSYTGGLTDPLFGFGFVQLSSYGNDPTVIDGFPVIRWAQTANYGYVPNNRMENVFMAVSMDLGNPNSPWGSIHPDDKQDVGYRLSIAGRAVAYSEKSLYYTGPIATKVQASSIKSKPGVWLVDVSYDQVGTEGIEILSRKGFEIFCEKAASWNQAIVLSSSFSTVSLLGKCTSADDQVTGIRYAWRQDPCPFKLCAVYSKSEHLPSPPFIKFAPF